MFFSDDYQIDRLIHCRTMFLHSNKLLFNKKKNKKYIFDDNIIVTYLKKIFLFDTTTCIIQAGTLHHNMMCTSIFYCLFVGTADSFVN